MSKKVFFQSFGVITIILGMLFIAVTVELQKKQKSPPCIVIQDTIGFMGKSPEKGLMEALDYYEVKFPEIVYAQAVLETRHFTSKICKEYNNLFGLYNNNTKNYYRFNHWSESVIAYINCIQYRYFKNESYYRFLEYMGYAEDPEYIIKLKRIVNHGKTENIYQKH